MNRTMRTPTRRTLGLIAAAALAGAGLVACGNDVADRQYCLEVARDVRVDDRFCESPGEPQYAWVWAERTSYVPGYYDRPGHRYYRYPVNDRGMRTQAPTRPARTATQKATTSRTDSETRATTTRSKGTSSTKGNSGTRGTSSGSKGSSSGSKGSSSGYSGSKGSSSGSKGSSSSGSKGSSSSRR